MIFKSSYMKELEKWPKKFLLLLLLPLIPLAFMYAEISPKGLVKCIRQQRPIYTQFDRFVQYKRRISELILQAAEDVKRGRTEAALKDLHSAAALLERTFESNSSSRNLLEFLNSTTSTFLNSTTSTFNRNSSPPISAFNEGLNLSSVLHSPVKTSLQNDLLGSLTILLYSCSTVYVKTRLINVMQQLNSQWSNLKIIIGVNEEDLEFVNKMENMERIFAMKVNCIGDSEGSINALIPHVRTPYVLYLHSISAAISEDLDISKLMQVAKSFNESTVVGVSERGDDGGWDYRCWQLYHENSQLTLKDGYHYSKGSCIFCDVTSMSFLTTVSVLKSDSFDEKLSLSERTIDWALRIKKKGIITLSCPDVMIHTVEKVIPPETVTKNAIPSCFCQRDKENDIDDYLKLKKIYRNLAQKWELTSIVLHNGTILEYNCREINFDCKARTRVRHYMLPPCCLVMKRQVINIIDKIAKEELIPYHVMAGTLLGAVKFKNSIPWDFDDDTNTKNTDVSLMKHNMRKLNNLGLKSSFNSYTDNNKNFHNYIVFYSEGGYTYEFFGRKSLESEVSVSKLKSLPGYLTCLQYGHFPIAIDDFLQFNSNLTKKMSTDGTVKKAYLKQLESKVIAHKYANFSFEGQIFPPILPLPSCFLLSFVRIGEYWVPAPWNPALKSRIIYGENIFKHQIHWRFKKKGDDGWPSCPTPGQTTCLENKPLDGSIPFI